jgi:electron transport complex protein RnfD
MWLVFFCSFLGVLQSAINDSGLTLKPALTALITALIVEYLLTWRNYGTLKIKDGSAAATAMLLTLLLPNQLHPVYAAFGVIFAIVVVKHSFGGLGANWFNPAIGGWLFIRFSWSDAFTSALEHTTVSITELSVTTDLSSFDKSITEFLNISVFSISGVRLPSGYIDLLFYNGPGLISDKGIFFLLIGTLIITAAGINRGWIPLAFLAVYGFLIRLAGDSELFWNGDLLYGFFSGGTIVTAFILAAEPASSAKFKSGILFTVILAAILSWFFRYKCLDYTGCFIAIAVVNCFTPLVRLIEEKIFLSDRNRRVIQENLL